MKVIDVINYLETRFPKSLALDFDLPRIGLEIGSSDVEVRNILLTLDLTMDVVNDAIKKGCNLIISHHPFIFDPLYKIEFDSNLGKILRKMFENNISLYAMHTNLDTGIGGVNDTLAKMIGIKDVNVINGEVEKGNLLRYGKVKKQKVSDLANHLKKVFNLNGVRIIGALDKEVELVGVIGGSGAHPSEISDAIRLNLDLYITGEVHLNNAIDAYNNNLTIIEVNHGVEKFVMYPLCNDLIKEFDLNGRVYVTDIETDPLISY